MGIAGIPMPPDIALETEDDNYRIAEQLQLAMQRTATYCESFGKTQWPRFAELLRSEGLDGGGKMSQLLYGGDAARTAKFAVAPVYVVQADLENATRSVIEFGNRCRVNIYDAIRANEVAKSRQRDLIKVNK